METETDSPQPTHPVREGLTRGLLVIVLGIVSVSSSELAYRVLLVSVGILNIIFGVVLILSLVWAEFSYFVCQL